MTKLQGTEKQVAWAEDIRTKWQGFATTLEAIADREEHDHETVVKDPIRKKEMVITDKVIRLTKEESATINGLCASFTGSASLTVDQDKGKKAKVERLAQLIKKAIETQEDAKFWINVEIAGK